MDRRRFIKAALASVGVGGLAYLGYDLVRHSSSVVGSQVMTPQGEYEFIGELLARHVVVYEKSGLYYAVNWRGERLCFNTATACIRDAVCYVANDCLSNSGNCRIGIIIKPGVYEISEPIDFRGCLSPYAPYYNFLNINSEPGSVIQASPSFSASGASAMVVLSPSAGAQIYLSKISLPYINASGAGNVNGLVMAQVNDSVVNLPGVSYAAKAGVVINEGGNPNNYPSIVGLPTAGFFNNIVTIGIITFNNDGLVTLGNGKTPLGVQANTFVIQHIYGNKRGIVLDENGNGSALNSMWNQFAINVVEHNSELGILDNSGGNIFRVNNANTNPHGTDFIESSSVIMGSYVIGYLADGYTLRRGLSRVINLWPTS